MARTWLPAHLSYLAKQDMRVAAIQTLQAPGELRSFRERLLPLFEEELDGVEVGMRQPHVEQGVFSQLVDPVLEDPDTPPEGRSGPEAHLVPGPAVAVEHQGVGHRALCQTLLLDWAEPHLQRVGDRPGHLLLDVEHVVQRAGEVLGPEVAVGRGVDELRGDAQVLAGFPDASLEHVAHVQQCADLANRLAGALQRHHGVPGDHPETADLSRAS